MYVPAHFSSGSAATATAVVKNFPFAIIISYDGVRQEISHIPLILSGSLEDGILHGHFARANPHSGMHGLPTTVIFSGPNTYISPSWYCRPGLPTWNYVAVHCHGNLIIDENEATLHQNLQQLLNDYEGIGPEAWSMSQLPRENLERGLKAIISFRMEVSSFEAKFKLSQNRQIDDRVLVRRELNQRDDDMSKLVAQMISTDIDV